MKKYKIIILFICSVIGFEFIFIGDANSQNKTLKSLSYDIDPAVFGWFGGVNNLYTNVTTKKIFPHNDSIMSFHAGNNIGFQLGGFADIKIFSIFHVKFSPNINFCNRSFSFLVKQNNVFHTTKYNFEVIFLDLPLEIKLFSKRWNNFRSYLLGGIKFDYDWGSIRRKKIADRNILFKINETEWAYSLGVGFDFYLDLCKMTLEFKSSFGMTDILNHEFQTVYSDCIEKMKTQMFYINLIFQ